MCVATVMSCTSRQLQKFRAREEELLAARAEVQELAPLRHRIFAGQLCEGSDLAALIKSGANNSLLSERGSVPSTSAPILCSCRTRRRGFQTYVDWCRHWISLCVR